MLTNLNWLNSGAEYPPAAEKERIESYKTNEKLFRKIGRASCRERV